MEREFILINIIGFDKPGVTSAVTEVLGKYGAFVQDIGQSNLHHQLNLSKKKIPGGHPGIFFLCL